MERIYLISGLELKHGGGHRIVGMIPLLARKPVFIYRSTVFLKRWLPLPVLLLWRCDRMLGVEKSYTLGVVKVLAILVGFIIVGELLSIVIALPLAIAMPVVLVRPILVPVSMLPFLSVHLIVALIPLVAVHRLLYAGHKLAF